MIKRGLKRLACIVGALAAAATIPSLIAGAATDTSAARSVSLGFMFVGALVFVGGAAVGLRGPVKPVHRPDGSFERLTMASPDDRIESINVSHLLVVIGIVFVVLGVVIAPNASLF